MTEKYPEKVEITEEFTFGAVTVSVHGVPAYKLRPDALASIQAPVGFRMCELVVRELAERGLCSVETFRWASTLVSHDAYTGRLGVSEESYQSWRNGTAPIPSTVWAMTCLLALDGNIKPGDPQAFLSALANPRPEDQIDLTYVP